MGDRDKLGILISKILADAYRRLLQEKKKVATRTTINSIKGDYRLTKDGVTAFVEADQGLFFIEKGRRPGGKLPVRKVGDKFRLVPRLQLWKNAVGFGGSDFLLARAIAKKGVKGVDITGEVLDAERVNISYEVGVTVTEDITDVIVQELKNNLKF